MNLIEVVRDLGSFDQEETIYASEPWNADSAALVAAESPASGPLDAKKLGLSYFLEVFIAREFLDGWLACLKEQDPTLQEKCERLIQYAMNDA